MACPHVSGIVALCYAASVCGSETGSEADVAVMKPSTAHSADAAAYRFTNDPLTNPLGDRYYGFMAWARKWWL